MTSAYKMTAPGIPQWSLVQVKYASSFTRFSYCSLIVSVSGIHINVAKGPTTMTSCTLDVAHDSSLSRPKNWPGCSPRC